MHDQSMPRNADKHERFKLDSITVGVCSQGCSKCPKQQVYNIFATSQGKCEGWSLFFATDKRQRSLHNDTIILVVWGQICPSYPR